MRLRFCAASVFCSIVQVANGQVVAPGSAPGYPSKPVRIVTGEAGGSPDFAARLIAQMLTGNLGQQVVVENRPSGIIPGDTVARANPDGYTLLFAANTLWTGPLLQKAPYDPVKDFAPIALTNSQPSVLVLYGPLQVSSVKELIAMAKARPGELNYASGPTGSAPHLAGELFKSLAGVDLVRVPYKGSGPALNGLIGGQVQLMFATTGSVAPHLKANRLKALAVTSAQPSTLAPGLPTVASSGVPGYEAASLQGMFAPARTPVTLVSRLNREIVEVLGRPEVKARFFDYGVEAVGSTPAQLAATVKSDIARISKVIKDAGIRDD